MLAWDHYVWDPGGGDAGAELWAHLRLLVSRAVWHLAVAGQLNHGQACTVAALVGRRRLG
jgi:hypothetical protein